MVADVVRKQREEANTKILVVVGAVLLVIFLFGAAVYVSGHLLAAHLLGRF